MVSTKSILLSCTVIVSLIKSGDGVRCYECRSDELPDCGDPFNPGRVPAVECDNLFTQSTFMCFKASHYAAGQYLTVRGCAPFTTETFPKALQRGMGGSYWKTASANVISLCDYNNCNAAFQHRISSPVAFAVAVLVSLRVAGML